MYFVKEVINLHKGKIDVVSEVGKGTTFTVTLPKNLKDKKRSFAVLSGIKNIPNIEISATVSMADDGG